MPGGSRRISCRCEPIRVCDFEGQLELLIEFVLLLLGEIAGADDHAAVQVAADQQFLDEQPGHDRLAGAGLVR
jgi:hypothetical protein